jgi:hypothetical protein
MTTDEMRAVVRSLVREPKKRRKLIGTRSARSALSPGAAERRALIAKHGSYGRAMLAIGYETRIRP